MIAAAGRCAALAWLACAGVAWAGVAGAGFHPVEDRPYRYDIDQTRTTDGVARRFHVSRSIVFHRTGSGYDVVVTLDALDHSPADTVGAMFQAWTGGLLHVPLRFRLDPAGRIVEVVDADAAIARIADAIATTERPPPDRPGRTGHTRSLATPFDTASPERKLALLRSILQPVVQPGDADHATGRRTVTLPSRPPLPVASMLTGTETVARNADIVTITIDARGTVATPLADLAPRVAQGAGGPVVTVRTTRTIDVASGLLLDDRDISNTAFPSVTGLHMASVETVVRVRPLAP